eukprot:SAG22_NODE_125_length_18883_cov_12.351629_3_plen_100_part_00
MTVSITCATPLLHSTFASITVATPFSVTVPRRIPTVMTLIATVRCERSGTARKGRETQGKAVITAFKREDPPFPHPPSSVGISMPLVRSVESTWPLATW